MIQPSALNLLIVGSMVVIFSFFWRVAAAKMADTPWGQSMATIL